MLAVCLLLELISYFKIKTSCNRFVASLARYRFFSTRKWLISKSSYIEFDDFQLDCAV